MDFGNTLDKWEKQKSGSDAHTAMDSWLDKYDVHDKDADAEDDHRSGAENRRRLRNKKPEDMLDIHGQTQVEAWQSLETFFADAKEKGLEKVLIIHGKGNHSQGDPVLKRTVMDFIERCPHAGERGKASTGGEGATWVIIKQPKKSN
jgi:DNA-nicking Smr family endonuclease